MTVEEQELETAELASEQDSVRGGYTSGGEVSAMTLIEDVRAIRLRLDAIEVALRGLGGRIEDLGPAKAEGAADGAAAAAPVGSLEELRKALVGDLQSDLSKNAKRSTMLMGVMLLTTLSGLGGLGWMVWKLTKAVAALE